MEKHPAVYIVTTRKNTALYTGVTSNLLQRIHQHRNGSLEGFTRKYNCKKLVFFEMHQTMEAAIEKEKQIKGWIREKKLALIESQNPGWRDLYEELV